MRDYFRFHAIRKVDRDRTVSLNGKLYEAPIPLIGMSVTLLYHENDPLRVEAFHDAVSHGMLVPLDLHINCRVRREKHLVTLLPESVPPAQQQPDKYIGGKLFGEVTHEL